MNMRTGLILLALVFFVLLLCGITNLVRPTSGPAPVEPTRAVAVAPTSAPVPTDRPAAPQPTAAAPGVSGCTLTTPQMTTKHDVLREVGPNPCNISLEWEVYTDSDEVNPISWGTFMGNTNGKTFVFPARGSGTHVIGTLYLLTDAWDLTQYSVQVRNARINGYKALGGVPPEVNGDGALPAGTKVITR